VSPDESWRAELEKAYHERNLLAAAFVHDSHLTGEVLGGEETDVRVLAGHDDPAPLYDGDDDEREWRRLWMELRGAGAPPTQLTWHVPAAYVPETIPAKSVEFDGHTVAEKNARLANYLGVAPLEPVEY